jgi:hypothetical protein
VFDHNDARAWRVGDCNVELDGTSERSHPCPVTVLEVEGAGGWRPGRSLRKEFIELRRRRLPS